MNKSCEIFAHCTERELLPSYDVTVILPVIAEDQFSSNADWKIQLEFIATFLSDTNNRLQRAETVSCSVI